MGKDRRLGFATSSSTEALSVSDSDSGTVSRVDCGSFLCAQEQAPPWLQQQVSRCPSTGGCKCTHLLVLCPQSHLTWADFERRIDRQCWHCDTGRPFLLMCCSCRSTNTQKKEVSAQRRSCTCVCGRQDDSIRVHACMAEGLPKKIPGKRE